MPWVYSPPQPGGLKGRENLNRDSGGKLSRPFRPRSLIAFLPRVSAWRPQPWAKLSRPVGPVFLSLRGYPLQLVEEQARTR